jgi:nicotinamide mononucleotide adenylyltransferase
MSDWAVECAREILIRICSDNKGITFPPRKTIEEAEAMIAEALKQAYRNGQLSTFHPGHFQEQ